MTAPRPYIYLHNDPGYLRISGDDRIDFIQRQSTNDVENLPPGRHISTVLTNPGARIIDILQIFQEDENTIGALTLPGRGSSTASFLKRRIFFMDKVTVTDASDKIILADIEGDGAENLLVKITASLPEDGEIIPASISGVDVLLAGQRGPGGKSYRIIGPIEKEANLQTALKEAGLSQISSQTYETLRITAGIPGATGELIEDYTPLETGLGPLVSSTKGCFTGQEVLARQITYDKVTRSLAGVELDGLAEAGARVLVAGQNVGTLTSYVESGSNGHLALAVIKKPHYEPGTEVIIEFNGKKVSGVVRELPFSNIN